MTAQLQQSQIEKDGSPVASLTRGQGGKGCRELMVTRCWGRGIRDMLVKDINSGSKFRTSGTDAQPGDSSYRTAPCAWKLRRKWVLNVIPTKKKKRYLCEMMEMVANLTVESFHDVCMHQITTASLHNLLY